MNRINQLACKAMCKMHTQKGVTMIEYVLIASLIAVVAIAALTTLGGDIKATWEAISAKLKPAP
jgi:pilus assembly protein Flp/PilA